MRRLPLYIAATISLLACSCSKNDSAKAINVADGGADAIRLDGSGQDSTASLVPCLDQPTTLPTPPMQSLPCDLLPPGFSR
jgi:hypothetical protein